MIPVKGRRRLKNRTNASVKAHYEQGHKYTSRQTEEDAVFNSYEWSHYYVLEIGCGKGTLAKRIYDTGAAIFASDYVDYDWDKTKRGPIYLLGSYKEILGHYDVVVMQGVLEHMDDPKETLEYIRDNFEPDTIISSSPCWFNPRGVVLQTLYQLFDLPITLADLHYLTPKDMELEGYKLTYKTVDHDWASGQKMIDDLENRLPKVLVNVGANVEKLISWLKEVPPQGLGATIIYYLEKI